ncbi:MAG TPA: DNA-processing protein DprA [Defluviitoga sp.]|nr:DNA-processing protein DprA [Defluviitoga sp.]HOP24342.1 DNA-processing protein DprA [Defluviitoga sp.]HPZ28668.1 DNA-processing protein DprA [Defluviitoga sp.]HQD62541.1 DNA-processing protein DprA [Defluviitoga sp.]
MITLKEAYKKTNQELIELVDTERLPIVFKEDFEEKKRAILKKLNNVKDLKILTYWDEAYPDLLKETNDPPVVIYYLGDISLMKSKKVSIVGTRKPTSYGKMICEKIAHTLDSYTVVSGLAYGIDSIAHLNSKKTIAVLGNGIDIIYPKSNENLYTKIKNEGLVISEYFPGTHPAKYTFPYRNRIIAGLSEKTIVVEASKKSGSLITARYALDYGREVLAVPGDITRLNSYGTNYLIYNGATPIISSEQLREIFGINNGFVNTANTSKDKSSFIEQNILKLIADGKDNLDLICDSLSDDVSLILSTIMKMEIEGKIVQENGVYYIFKEGE